jgi:hypothetical protein
MGYALISLTQIVENKPLDPNSEGEGGSTKEEDYTLDTEKAIGP